MSLGKKLGFFSAFILPTLLIVGSYLGGFGYALAFLFSFALLPILDYLLGLDPSNIPDEEIPFISKEGYYRFVLYTWVFIQTALLLWCFYHISTVKMTPSEWLGFTLGTGTITGGIGITVAHELGHKHSKLQRIFSKILLMEVNYMHFIIEHNRGHHVHVGTLQDPATARKGESFYKFWFRSVFKGYLHAWTIENQRLSKAGSRIISLNNQMIGY